MIMTLLEAYARWSSRTMIRRSQWSWRLGRRYGGPIARAGVLFISVSVIAGCAPTLRPIFNPTEPAIFWPAPPNPPRIKYVGQLRSSADLRPPTNPLAKLGDWVFGAKKPTPLYGPRAVVRTANGSRLWVADAGGRCLHALDLDTREYVKITKVGDNSLLSPVGVCLGPPGSIFVCDSESVAIHRLSDTTGELIQTLQLSEDILRPVALVYDALQDELFVVDVSAHDIKVLGPDGSVRRTLGGRGNGAAEFNFPLAVVLDDDTLWVADMGNNRILGMTTRGHPVRTFGKAGDSPGDLAMPKGIALDSEGHIYVVDGRFENVQVFDRRGQLLLAFGGEGTGPGEFWLPGGVYIDPTDRIWISDSYNRRVQVFDYLKQRGGQTDGTN